MKSLIVSLFLALHLAALLASPFVAGQVTNNGLSEYGYKGWQHGSCIYVETDQCDSGE